jgi:hypothetical protein
MAVVPNPRYEGAKVYELPKEYHNSLSNGLIQEYTKLIKEKKNMKLFQIFMPKKNEAAEKKDEKKEEVEKLNADETMVEIDGQQIPLSEIIKAYQAEKAEEAVKGNSGDTEKIPLKAEDEIDIDGKKEKVGDIINCYKNRMKKNAETPIDTKAESVVDEAAQKQNAINSANFKKLQNAVAKAGSEFKISVLTREERIASGKSKYGGKA